MRDLDLLAYRDAREARRVLDLYVQIANSLFEEIKLTSRGGEDIETLAIGERVSEERLVDMKEIDTNGDSALGCVHFFGLQFLAYIFERLGIHFMSLVKLKSYMIPLITLPVKTHHILWRKLPEISWREEETTGDLIYRCSCRVGIVRKNDKAA
jgi:hypothetical protein